VNTVAFESARTRLREFDTADAEAVFAWCGDPEVMRYIPKGPDASVEITRRRIARYQTQQAAHPFGRWLVVERNSGQLIGDAGFLFLPDGVRVELGYRLKKSYWGQGLAQEIAACLLAAARSRFGWDEVHAFAHPDNAASLHILHKLGFRFQHHERLYDWDVPVFVKRLAE
jgi:[ribosomal protein S5]-alanine N-acetyltransferase